MRAELEMMLLDRRFVDVQSLDRKIREKRKRKWGRNRKRALVKAFPWYWVLASHGLRVHPNGFRNRRTPNSRERRDQQNTQIKEGSILSTKLRLLIGCAGFLILILTRT